MEQVNVKADIVIFITVGNVKNGANIFFSRENSYCTPLLLSKHFTVPVKWLIHIKDPF